MDYGKHNNVHKDDSFFAGAILMSNRTTKLECLQKKLFGLPHSKARFLSQVKSGMILFLFEHEERKLYGVFEATSDGAFNIIPDAFRSTGRSYPAQILFKRIWMCRPLTENEFGSAIRENYYSPNKFHFGLSYNQIIKLIHLFYPKRINIKQYQRSEKPNQIFEKFKNSERGRYFMCDSEENDREGNREAGRCYVLPQSSMDLPRQYNGHATSLQETASNDGTGSIDVDFCAVKDQLPYALHTNYETANSQWEGSSVFLPHDHIEMHSFSVGKEPSTTPVMNPKSLPQQRTFSEQLSYSLHSNYETIGSQWKSSSGCPRGHIEFHHSPVGKNPSTTPEMDYTLLPQQSTSSSTVLNNMTVPYLKDLYHRSNDSLADYLPCTDYCMMPRMIETQGAALRSLYILNDSSHQTEALQQTCVYGAQPTQKHGFPDYIPLPEELEQKIVCKEKHICGLGYPTSTALNSCIPSTCNKISDAFNGSDEPKHHQILEADEDHPATLEGRLHSDSYMSRASVFSRLSQDGKVCNQNESPEDSNGLSLDQLLNILSEKRDRWSITKVSEQLIGEDCNEQYGSTAVAGQFNQSSGHQHKIKKLPVQVVERSNNDQYEGIAESNYDGFTAPFDFEQCNEVVAKNSFELPFYNFKRRKISQNHINIVSDEYGDICDLEGASRKSKRKILRPSMDGEKNPNVIGESEVKLSTPSILNSEVPLLSVVRKFEPEGESVDRNHAPTLDGTQDFIPIA